MRPLFRNILATVLVAAIAVPYVGYLVRGSVPLVQDPRGMAGVGLVLGIGAVVVAGRAALRRDPAHRTAAAAGLLTAGLGVAAVWAEDSQVLLAAFMIGIGVTWAAAELAAHLSVAGGHRSDSPVS
jgi:hypothetical protein